MNVKPAKVRAKLFLLLNTDVLEVLASENDYSSFCNEKCQLIFLHVGQFGELKPFDLGSNARGQFRDLDFAVFCVKKMGLRFIRFQPTINELKWFRRWELGSLIVNGEITIVFVLQKG